MKKEDIVKVIDKWAELVEELGGTYPWVQVLDAQTRRYSRWYSYYIIRSHFSLDICKNLIDELFTLCSVVPVLYLIYPLLDLMEL